MTLAESLDLLVRLRVALAVGMIVSLVVVFVVTPRAIRKLRGAGIVGRDMHKPGRPEVPEMGGLAVFLAFNVGAFATLAFANISAESQRLVLAGLVVAAGACITGILDDLIALRQRFKAVIPFAFAAPLALFVSDWSVWFPVLGDVDVALAYPLLLVPVAVACASNSFNMLEGFNGLGAGLGILMAGALSAMAILSGNLTGLALLFPLLGALVGFLWFNFYPARVFPGDTMTLMVGAVIAIAGLLSKLEFWVGLLFVPHVLEFFWKALHGFPRWGVGELREDGRLYCPESGPNGLVQASLKVLGGASESRLFVFMIGGYAAYAAGVFLAFAYVQQM